MTFSGMKTDTEIAFRWIVEHLQELSTPFMIVGGLAAQAYGSKRPLADIDIYVPEPAISILNHRLSRYVTFGPEKYVDEYWDLEWMALSYHNQKIEIGNGDVVRICDHASQKWLDASVNFEHHEVIPIFDIPVPVIAKSKLIWYKRRLHRKVDEIDVFYLLQ